MNRIRIPVRIQCRVMLPTMPSPIFTIGTVGTSSMSRTITGLSAGATYRFETYIASLAGGSPDALVVTLQWQDGSGGNVGSIVSLVDASAGDNTWIQVEETGIVAPSGATQVVLEVAFEDRGGNDAFTDIFTDEFTFEETAAAPVNSDPVFANGTVRQYRPRGG